MQVDDTPFAIIRARTLFGRYVLAGSATVIISLILWGACLKNQPVMLGTYLMMLLFDGLLLLLIARLVLRAKLAPAAVLGPQLPWPRLGRYALLVFPLWVVANASMYLLYFPLSYLIPGFVQWWLFDLSRFEMWTSDSPLTNLLGSISVVLLGPLLEEFVFRGLLLTRWSLKWNVPRAILVSSILFGLGHRDVIGAFFSGYVLCVLYIQTKSLFVPIIVHTAYNGAVWILDGVEKLLYWPDTQVATLAEWQSEWWVGLLAALVAIPWVIWFTKRNFPTNSWQAPYVALRRNVEETGCTAA